MCMILNFPLLYFCLASMVGGVIWVELGLEGDQSWGGGGARWEGGKCPALAGKKEERKGKLSLELLGHTLVRCYLYSV